MTWSALAWASKQKTGSSNNKLVLLMLANYADEQNKCFPSFKKLCEMTELSRATIIRSINNLELSGFVIREERYSEFEGGNRQTSNQYTLQVGYQTDTHESQSETPPSITVRPHITNHKEPLTYTEEFERFWKVYPNNSGSKKKAFELWLKVTKSSISKEELFKLCEKYNKITLGKDVKFIPHCTTWLNQQRWETVKETPTKRINLNQLVG